jgi:hypothetical protein
VGVAEAPAIAPTNPNATIDLVIMRMVMFLSCSTSLGLLAGKHNGHCPVPMGTRNLESQKDACVGSTRAREAEPRLRDAMNQNSSATRATV